jgi:glucan phosphoethanolaminetransferase (alkaline phosphatase superfamily)
LVYSKFFYPHGSTSIFADTNYIVFLAVVLSIITYYTVENPIRIWKSKKIVFVLIFIMIAIGVSSIYLSQSDYSRILDDEEKRLELIEKFDI